LSHARAQGDEKLVQLLATLHPGEGVIENFLRRKEFARDQQRLAVLFLKGHRRHGSVIASLIGPDKRACGLTSMYLPKNTMEFDLS